MMIHIRSPRALAAGLALGLVFSAPPASAQLMSLGGKFEVGAMGNASYTVPLAVPPGTAGLVPSLSLEYSSNSGNGIIGKGWALTGISSIGRCQRTLAQDGVRGGVAFDANDRFCLEGQRLVAVSGAYGADGTEYRTELEGYSKIISHGVAGTGPAWFEVRTKSGQVMEFGNTADSRSLAQGKTTARNWGVNKVSDTKGNYFTVTYFQDATTRETYPTQIDYTGNAAAGLAPYNSVRFTYVTRTDPSVGYAAGSKYVSTVLLTNVKTYAGLTLVNDYRLAYQSGITPLNRAKLQSLTRCDGASNCLPATTFTWAGLGNGSYSVAWNQPVNALPLWSAGGSTTYTGDIDGDGKSDLIQIENVNYHAQVLLANGDGSFRVAWTQANNTPPFWSAGGSSTYLGDVNGDGLIDAIQIQNTHYAAQVLLSNGDGSFRVGFNQPENALPFWSASGSSSFMADVNGDGLADVIQIEKINYHAQVLLSNGDGTFRVGWTQANNTPPFWSSGGSSTYIADFNGDGLADVLQIENNHYHAQILLSNGDGSFRVGWTQPDGALPLWSAGGSSTFLADVNGDGLVDVVQIENVNYHAQVLLSTGDGTLTVAWMQPNGSPPIFAAGAYSTIPADVNGDGLIDLIQVGNTHYHAQVLFSNGDGTYTVAWTQLENTPPFWTAAGSTPTSGDFNGDGLSDVLQISKNYYQAEVMTASPGGGDLLSTITTGLGSVTSLTYKRLTDSSVYTKGTGAVFPVSDVQGPLAVVSRVDVSTGVGGTYGTSYRYSGLKSDISGRGMLGFRQTTLTDLQTGVVQTTTYRQDYPYIGQVANATKTLGALTLNQSVNTYLATSLGGTRYAVDLQQTVEASNDLDGTAMPTVTTSYQYDAFGNATQVTVSTPDGAVKTTVNAYVNDTGNWLLGRLMASSVTSTIP